jgi:excisionase family DNA binding protein
MRASDRRLTENSKPMVLTVSEVASSLRVSRQVVYRLIHSGQLRAVRTGHQLRIPWAAFENLISGQKSWEGSGQSSREGYDRG